MNHIVIFVIAFFLAAAVSETVPGGRVPQPPASSAPWDVVVRTDYSNCVAGEEDLCSFHRAALFVRDACIDVMLDTSQSGDVTVSPSDPSVVRVRMFDDDHCNGNATINNEHVLGEPEYNAGGRSMSVWSVLPNWCADSHTTTYSVPQPSLYTWQESTACDVLSARDISSTPVHLCQRNSATGGSLRAQCVNSTLYRLEAFASTDCTGDAQVVDVPSGACGTLPFGAGVGVRPYCDTGVFCRAVSLSDVLHDFASRSDTVDVPVGSRVVLGMLITNTALLLCSLARMYWVRAYPREHDKPEPLQNLVLMWSGVLLSIATSLGEIYDGDTASFPSGFCEFQGIFINAAYLFAVTAATGVAVTAWRRTIWIGIRNGEEIPTAVYERWYTVICVSVCGVCTAIAWSSGEWAPMSIWCAIDRPASVKIVSLYGPVLIMTVIGAGLMAHLLYVVIRMRLRFYSGEQYGIEEVTVMTEFKTFWRMIAFTSLFFALNIIAAIDRIVLLARDQHPGPGSQPRATEGACAVLGLALFMLFGTKPQYMHLSADSWKEYVMGKTMCPMSVPLMHCEEDAEDRAKKEMQMARRA